jgi:hypothetical protein
LKSRTASTLPSAGLKTAFSGESFVRSGSLKKHIVKRVMPPIRTAADKNPAEKKITEIIKPDRTKIKPSLAISNLFSI